MEYQQLPSKSTQKILHQKLIIIKFYRYIQIIHQSLGKILNLHTLLK